MRRRAGDGAQLHDRPALDAGVQAPHLLPGQLSHPGVFIEAVVFLGVFYRVSTLIFFLASYERSVREVPPDAGTY